MSAPWRDRVADTVDEHLAALPPEQRAVMEGLRATINAAAPDATETIAYSMPALRTADGRFLLSYDAYQRHYSLFPASDEVVKACGEELRPYLAGKGTIRFPAGKPIPTALVTKIVEARVREMASGARR
jgi:uncharacterized protein YdhG (YjbR/CyaY superfamily)